MSKLKTWFVTKYYQLEEQAIKAIETTNFYGNLFTNRQKLYIIVALMALMALGGAYGAVYFIGFVYIMFRLTPEDEDEK